MKRLKFISASRYILYISLSLIFSGNCAWAQVFNHNESLYLISNGSLLSPAQYATNARINSLVNGKLTTASNIAVWGGYSYSYLYSIVILQVSSDSYDKSKLPVRYGPSRYYFKDPDYSDGRTIKNSYVETVVDNVGNQIPGRFKIVLKGDGGATINSNWTYPGACMADYGQGNKPSICKTVDLREVFGRGTILSGRSGGFYNVPYSFAISFLSVKKSINVPF